MRLNLYQQNWLVRIPGVSVAQYSQSLSTTIGISNLHHSPSLHLIPNRLYLSDFTRIYESNVWLLALSIKLKNPLTASAVPVYNGIGMMTESPSHRTISNTLAMGSLEPHVTNTLWRDQSCWPCVLSCNSSSCFTKGPYLHDMHNKRLSNYLVDQGIVGLREWEKERRECESVDWRDGRENMGR